MHISKEETGVLTASVKIQITKPDYEEKVSKTLREYQRKANMPGFRPGKVPFGLISKMYKKGVMLDEINHLLSENLYKYIEENNLELIGSPVPNREMSPELDFESNSDFEFTFDIGLQPAFELDLSILKDVEYYRITANDRMIDEQIYELRHRMMEHHDHEAEHEKHPEEELPALTEEFFGKIFPGIEIKDLESFRIKIKESIESSLAKDAERYLLNSAVEKLVKETLFDLPDDFLRKMAKANNDQSLTDDQFEVQFDNLRKSLRWQLIESRLIKDNNLFVSEAEIRNVVKSYFTGHLSNDEVNPEQEERLNQIVDSVLGNKEESTRLHDQIYDQKLMAFFKSQVHPEQKDIDYDEFVKIIAQKSEVNES